MKKLTALALLIPFLAAPLAGRAEDKKPAKKEYPLDKCVVSDEKLGGDMGKPYVFTHEGREVQLCCKSCLKDFNKEPAKYLKKIEEAQKTPEKK